jgi:hypothetical protein
VTLEEPRSPWGRIWRALVGAALQSGLEIHERLSKNKTLAGFSSDALSSVAYPPQETLVILLAAGTARLTWSLPSSIAVVVLLASVAFSYRRTIYAYPSGGGPYIVAHKNLGELPGLVAAAALSVGCILTCVGVNRVGRPVGVGGPGCRSRCGCGSASGRWRWSVWPTCATSASPATASPPDLCCSCWPCTA